MARKTTFLSLWLFGKPGWELDMEDKELDESFADKLEALGEVLRETLKRAADVLRKLLAEGWSAYGGLYTIDFYKDVPIEQARKELRELGLEDLEDSLEEVSEETEEDV